MEDGGVSVINERRIRWRCDSGAGDLFLIVVIV